MWVDSLKSNDGFLRLERAEEVLLIEQNETFICGIKGRTRVDMVNGNNHTPAEHVFILCQCRV